MRVNGNEHRLTTDPDRPLLDVLREDLHLNGTHYGCGAGDCGACSVLVDGKRIFSCSTAINEVAEVAGTEAAGQSITTIEGLSNGAKLHPVQQAFLDEGAFQCGYCTPGMIVAATALLKEKPSPSDAEIIEGMNGNICRCCGYARMISAIRRAAEQNGGAK
ncbi:MAG: (2Fe-2S)-binding protein [Burkholderiales bacterium]|nr:(2Fe-2S)-binding protein [Phycisphaerae bacterium]